MWIEIRKIISVWLLILTIDVMPKSDLKEQIGKVILKYIKDF